MIYFEMKLQTNLTYIWKKQRLAANSTLFSRRDAAPTAYA